MSPTRPQGDVTPLTCHTPPPLTCPPHRCHPTPTVMSPPPPTSQQCMAMVAAKKLGLRSQISLLLQALTGQCICWHNSWCQLVPTHATSTRDKTCGDYHRENWQQLLICGDASQSPVYGGVQCSALSAEGGWRLFRSAHQWHERWIYLSSSNPEPKLNIGCHLLYFLFLFFFTPGFRVVAKTDSKS